MRIVVVDDSKDRVALIKATLEKRDFSSELDVVYCGSADEGRRALMASCDLLLLDVLIPKKNNGTPQARNSITLLADVCSDKGSYIRPRLIIGLTADINELGNHREEFAKEATIVLSGTLIEVSWLDRLIQQIESLLGVSKKTSKASKDRLFISAHGIRTYGHWQSNLSKVISEHSRSFECIEVKYGFLDLISFLIPKQRGKAIEKTAQRIRSIIKENQNREISIVAHSFGTLIVARALKGYTPTRLIKTIIFCGSPMCSEEDIDNVVKSAELTLNDCGIHDVVLLASRFFGMGLGDAGRVGFERENSSKFRNRFFAGGHGLYFHIYGKRKIFFERYWLPMLISGAEPVPFDARRDYLGQDIVDLIIKFFTATKPFSGCLLVLALLFGTYKVLALVLRFM